MRRTNQPYDRGRDATSLAPSGRGTDFEASARNQGEGPSARIASAVDQRPPRAQPLTLLLDAALEKLSLSPKGRGTTRHGFTLIELAASCAVIGVVFLMTIPLLSQIRQTQRESARSRIAQRVVANVMERVALQSASANGLSATLDDLQQLDIATLGGNGLPDARLDVQSQSDDGPLSGTRVTVTLDWTSDNGRSHSESLTAWWPQEEG